LMYLFDELPEEDRAEVESMLNTDKSLYARFEQLQASRAGPSETTSGLFEERRG